ncbi:unnamed protein product [Prorocentrum cordatum]|uniref:Uncharacterized protein n=1 Tax=Prorocentrum cordatum TaxID=2364126 RepID=A0ABN9Y2C1_9DINO|nr:unnamed protein product [Polarella glacialis]
MLTPGLLVIFFGAQTGMNMYMKARGRREFLSAGALVPRRAKHPMGETLRPGQARQRAPVAAGPGQAPGSTPGGRAELGSQSAGQHPAVRTAPGQGEDAPSIPFERWQLTQ